MELSLFKLDHKTTSLTPLFLNESCRSIAVSLLSFFSVIFIYKKILEFTGDQVLAFICAFSFFAILQVFKLIGTFMAENLALSWGLKKQVLLGSLLTMAAIIGFSVSEKNLSFLILPAVLWGLAIGFYWYGYRGLVAKTGYEGEYGEAIGWSGIINSFFVLGVPFLGGFLIKTFGYQALFLTSFVIILFGFFPLLRLHDHKTHQDILFGEMLKLILSHKKMSLAYFALGACGEIYSLVLILYVFLFLGQEFSFGKFFSASLLLVAGMNFLIGKWTDRKGKEGLVSYGAIFASLVWWGRFFVVSLPALLIFDVIDRISGGMVGIPMAVLTYEKAIDGRSTGRALLFREMTLTLGSIFSTLFLILLSFLGFRLSTAFLVAGVLMLTPLLIVKKELVTKKG